MKTYWAPHFLPLDFSLFKWLGKHYIWFFAFSINTIFTRLNQVIGLGITFLLVKSVIQNFHLIRQSKRILWDITALSLPLLIHLTLSAMKMYPFNSGRLTLYLSVPLIYSLSRIDSRKIKFNGLSLDQFIYPVAIVLTILSTYTVLKEKVIDPIEDVRPLVVSLSKEPDNCLVFIHSKNWIYSYYHHTDTSFRNSGRAFSTDNIEDICKLNIPVGVKTFTIVETPWGNSIKLSRKLKKSYVLEDGRKIYLERTLKKRDLTTYSYCIL
jgi:hypothetical protein